MERIIVSENPIKDARDERQEVSKANLKYITRLQLRTFLVNAALTNKREADF